MNRPRFVKVLRDLVTDRWRNAMMGAAVTIGVLSVGTILGAYAVLTREMTRNYLGTNPAEFTIELDGSIPRSLVETVRSLPDVADAERHATVLARMRVGEDWQPLLLFVVDDFTDLRLNRFRRLSGAWPPATGTMLLERTAIETAKPDARGRVVVRTPHGTAREVVVSGLVHDPGLAPARQEQEGYGYVTPETLQWLGETQGMDELRVKLRDPRASIASIEGAARRVAERVQAEGCRVREIQVPPPRRHPHQGQMTAVLTLFLAFSGLTLVLAAILVSTSLATVMARQVREIGVMKAIGATSGQVAALYLLAQSVTAAVGTAVGVPASRHTAALMSGKIAAILNLQLVDARVPAWVSVVQCALGLLVPLGAALLPVWRASRAPVRQALATYGVSTARVGRSGLNRLAAVSRVLGRSAALALRNAFRNRGLLVMSTGLLAAGGALFMTATNVAAAWDRNLQKIYRFRHYDVEMRLSEAVDASAVARALGGVRDVRAIEAWSLYPASFAGDGAFEIVHVYPDKGHGSFSAVGVPANTAFVDFPLLGGRWLRGGPEVVLNHTARATVPGLRVGDRVTLGIEGRASSFTVVGFVEDIGSPGGVAYVPADALRTAAGAGANATNMVRVALGDRGTAAVQRATRALENALEPVAYVRVTYPMSLIRNAIAEHMSILVTSLIALAALMAIVGGFGLASTMSVNILERTREIGVMRAIGATPARVARLLVLEGFAIAALSDVAAFAAAVAASSLMGRLLGAMAFRTPLPLVISRPGLAIWTLILVVGTGLATAVPVRRASGITVREALSYP